jgi:2'-5' RNA ligase
MAQVRTFIAVDLPREVKAQIADIIAELRPLGSAVRWVRPEGLHLTLKFLGEIPEEQLAVVYSAVARGVKGIAPFSFDMAELGGFPNLHNPRVIWVGVRNGVEPLHHLYQGVELQLAQCGFPGDKRKFSPHLTIGRVKTPHGLEPILTGLSSLSYESTEIPVAAVKVMRSQLKPTGAEYSALKVVDLELGGFLA